MVASNRILTGKIRGKFIELDRDLGLPDGEAVTIRIESGGAEDQSPKKPMPSGDGFRKSAGTWADDGEALDRFIDATYRARS